MPPGFLRDTWVMEAAPKQGNTGQALWERLVPSPTRCPRRKRGTYTALTPILYPFPADHHDLALIKG